MVPLVTVPSGKRVRLVGVDAGRRFQAKLAAMGLVSGTELEVVSSLAGGPLIVEAKGTRLMLGRRMARKILVE